MAALVAGVSAADAAREHGVSLGTVKGWLRGGRADPGSRYGWFAREVDAARVARESPERGGLVDEREVLELSVVGRAGGFGGGDEGDARDWRERPEPDRAGDILDELDELARRRLPGGPSRARGCGLRSSSEAMEETLSPLPEAACPVGRRHCHCGGAVRASG